MNNYRLKKEAVKFFKEKYATEINTLGVWEDIGIDIVALEEVEKAYLTFGHKDLENKSSSLSGWNSEMGSHFHFTLHFPSAKYKEHDKFSNGKILRKLLNKFQEQVDYFYSNFDNK